MDWFNAGKWGEGREVCEEIGVNYQYVANCGSVCNAFDFSPRSEKLTFKHYRMAMAASPEGRQRWLVDQNSGFLTHNDYLRRSMFCDLLSAKVYLSIIELWISAGGLDW